MQKLVSQKHTGIFIVSLVLALGALFVLPRAMTTHYVLGEVRSIQNTHATTTTPIPTVPEEPLFTPSYVATPSPVKAIYMTSWVAGTPSLRNGLVKIAEDTEINSIVIDIKDYSGKIVFKVTDPTLKAFGSEEIRVSDLPEFIESLHQKGIYVIGRVAVFQDAYFVKLRPDLAVKNKAGTATWKDHKGISWIDAGSKEYWDYILLIAKESHKIGFDEINFDYIRFPSDGNMQDISFPHSSTTPKAEVMKEFFSYVHENLKDTGLKTSADLFGMVTTATDDMGIGQLLENALPYFDYICPMVYPSHYPATFQGYAKPEAHPYEVVKYAMQSAVNRRAKMEKSLASTTGETLAEFRPWLQDFGLGQTYGPAEVRAQIKATNDVGLDSWLLWSASNKYTKGALDAE